MILEKVPHVLQNKALILSKDGNDINYFAVALCALVSKLKILFLLKIKVSKFLKKIKNQFIGSLV